MNVSFSIKQRKGNAWDHIGLASVAGKTLEEMMLGCQGKEVVAEFVLDDERLFCCGTGFWLDRMQRKGKAVLFRQAIDLLKARCPKLLDEIIPAADLISEIFPEAGAAVESCTFENVSDGNGL